MPSRRQLLSLAAVLAIGIVAVVFAYQSGLIYYVAPPNPDSYERVTVTAYDDNGTQLATVEARVADTRPKLWLGLSDTENLSMDEGMLFVHAAEGERGYVMRNMAFPLDIVFIGADERVTAIRHASVPDGSADRTYTGRGKWVLEVPRGWTNRTGVDVGDRIAVPPAAENASDLVRAACTTCLESSIYPGASSERSSERTKAAGFAAFPSSEDTSPIGNESHGSDGLLAVRFL